jgi:hypothetical protein
LTFLKKIIAIPLIAVYLFNLVGYSLYTNYYIQQADKRIVQQIDNNTIDEQQLIELKTPIDMPYYNDSREYQRMDGKIVLDGIHYNYVKRKIHNDTLYLLCLPNFEKTTLNKDKNNFAGQVNDLPSNNKENNTAKKNGFSNEYVYRFIHYEVHTPLKKIQPVMNNKKEALPTGHLLFNGQPPQVSC